MSGLRINRLAALLAAAWEAEMFSILTLESLSEAEPDLQFKARLISLSGGCQIHASRLLARLAAIGGGPLPVPPSEIELLNPYSRAVRYEAEKARSSADRYSLIANLARKEMDPSAAWVCELNRAEELDRAFELSERARRAEVSAALAPPG